MPTAINAPAHEIATMRDKLGRLFDPKKFRAAFDSAGRWLNAHAGRKPGKKSRQLSLSMSSDASASVSAPSAVETAETPAPVPGEAKPAPDTSAPGDSTPPPAPAAEPKPSFADIERAAGPVNAAPVDSGASGESGEGDAAELGLTTADSIIGIIQTALVLIGEDEGILTKAEVLILRPPLERVLKKYNVGATALPAEVDLAVALAGLVITRLKKPKTATFFAKVKLWFAGKVAERKGRAMAATVSEVTQ